MGESAKYCASIYKLCQKSSQVHRLIIISLLASLFLVIVLLGIVLHHHVLLIGGCHDVTCVLEASKIIQRINAEEEPCNDFYKFACENRYEYVQEAEDQKIMQLHSIILEDAANDTDALKLSKKLYRACLKNTEVDYTKVLKQKIELVGGWPVFKHQPSNEFNWLQALSNIRNMGIPLDIFLGLTIETDFYNKTLLKVLLPPLDNVTQFENHKKTWRETAIELGAQELNVKDALNAISLLLITKTKKSFSTLELVTPGDLQIQCPNINWTDFFKIFLGRDNTISTSTLIVADVAKINERLRLLFSTPKDTLANYMMWKVTDSLIPFLKKISYENEKRHCTKILADVFSLNPIDNKHAKRYLTKAKVKKIVSLVVHLANTYARILKMSKNIYGDTDSFINKITNVKIEVGPSKVDLEDNNVILDEDLTFLEIVLLCNRLQKDWLFSKFDKTDLMPWHINNYIFTPKYFEKYNTLYIPSSAVGDVFFNELRPNYLNYGSLGPLIAYEFTNFVHENLLEEEFLRNQSRCFDADAEKSKMMASVQVSRKAYTTWVRKHKKEHKLINLVYEPAQLFWISASPALCETSSYALLNNVQEFAVDFRCMENSNICDFVL